MNYVTRMHATLLLNFLISGRLCIFLESFNNIWRVLSIHITTLDCWPSAVYSFCTPCCCWSIHKQVSSGSSHVVFGTDLVLRWVVVVCQSLRFTSGLFQQVGRIFEEHQENSWTGEENYTLQEAFYQSSLQNYCWVWTQRQIVR